MARIRTIKPEMAKHELLFELEQELRAPVRFAWAQLPCHADREGRFKWRPRSLKTDILPYDDCDFSRVLHAWLTRGMIVKYRVGDEWFGWIVNFRKHQVINAREQDSILPSIDDAEECEDYRNQTVSHASATRDPRVIDASGTRHVHARGEGKGREGKGREHLQHACPTRDEHSEGKPPDPGEQTQADAVGFEQLQRLKAAYPKGIYPQSDWLIAERQALQRIDDGHTWDEFIGGAQRYAAQCDAKGSTGTQYVRSPKDFFEAKSPRFLDPFPLPIANGKSASLEDTGWRPTAGDPKYDPAFARRTK